MPSITKIKTNSSNKTDSMNIYEQMNFVSKNINGSNYENKTFEHKEHSHEELFELNKSRRGLIFDQNQENIFIGNLQMNEEAYRKSLTEVKRHKDIPHIDKRDLINIEVNNELHFDDSNNLGESLYQINENELENLESSADKIPDLDDRIETAGNLKSHLTNFIEGMPQNSIFSHDNTDVKAAHHRSNSSIKESLRYSNIDEEKQNTTLTKFISNADLKYATNNSSVRRRKLKEDNYYEDDVDGCKKLIDFHNFSHLKETPNISNASNIKSYGWNESDTHLSYARKFTKHTRGGSIQDSDKVPVKEVNVYEISDFGSERINNLKSF
jgi:hypothetical protein